MALSLGAPGTSPDATSGPRSLYVGKPAIGDRAPPPRDLPKVTKENTGQSLRTNPVLSGGEKLKLLTLMPSAIPPNGFGTAVNGF